MELGLWCMCHLQYEHFMWTVVLVPAAPLLVQLLVHAPGTAVEDELSAWVPALGEATGFRAWALKPVDTTYMQASCHSISLAL